MGARKTTTMVKRKRDASNEKGQEEEKEDEEGGKEDGNEEKEEEEEEADAQEEENLDAKVASMSCPRIWIKVRTEEGQVEISVAQNDSVHGSISSALGSGACSHDRASSSHTAHAYCLLQRFGNACWGITWT